jgi:hypothetical protein
MYQWHQTHIDKLKSLYAGDKTSIVSRRGGVAQRVEVVSQVNAHEFYRGGGVVCVKYADGTVKPSTLADLDPETMGPVAVQAPPAATAKISADGKHAERTLQIGELVNRVKVAIAESQPGLARPQAFAALQELPELVKKDTAQRYEAIIELRVKDAVEAALKQERDRFQHDAAINTRIANAVAAARQEYLDEYGKRMANMKLSFQKTMDDMQSYCQAAAKILSEHRDWREPQTVRILHGLPPAPTQPPTVRMSVGSPSRGY